MRRLLLLSLIAVSLLAEEKRGFPDDYVPSPCAPGTVCESYKPGEIVTIGARTQAYTEMKPDWVLAHWNEIIGSLAPYCRKLATCYAQPNNTNMFCDDLVMPEMVATCETRYSKDSNDYVQCIQMVRTFGSGVTLKSHPRWKEGQECLKSAPAAATRKFEVWMTPETIPLGYTGRITVYALDTQTRVPVKAEVTVGSETLYAKATPDGKPTTWYWFNWKPKLVKVPNATGHHDVAAPTVKVSAPGYETVSFPMPVPIGKMVAEMSPATIKRGKNSVTITARDAQTGAPVQAYVMFDNRYAGLANQPIELVLERGEKRPEIWITSYEGHYSDVIVAPAER